MKICLALLFACPAASIFGCTELALSQRVEMAIPARQSVCVQLQVVNDEPVQVVAEQREDLQMRVSGKDEQLWVDGFAFGPETVTLPAPGEYRVELRIKTPADRIVITTVMLRKGDPLHHSAEYIAAESAATRANQSKTPQDAEAAEQLWAALGDELACARLRLRQAEIRFGSGDYQGARALFETGRTMCQHAGNLRCLAEASNNAGWTASLLGDYEAARAGMLGALAAWRKLGDRRGEGRTLSNLGLLYRQAAEYQKAIDIYEQARRLTENQDRQAYAWVLNNLGVCYMWLGEYTQALLWLRRAAAQSAAAHGADDDLLYRMNLGHVLMLMNRLGEAESILNAALLESEKRHGSNAGTRAWILSNLGQTLWREHRTGEAEGHLNSALHLFNKYQDKAGTAAALHYLGLIAQECQDSLTAVQRLERALEIRLACGLRDAAVETLTELADIRFARGEFAEAHLLAERGAKLLESTRAQVTSHELRAAYFARQRKLLDLLVEIAMLPSNPNAAKDGVLAAERGRARSLLDLTAASSQVTAVPVSLAARQTDLNRRIDLISGKLATASGAHANDLAKQMEGLLSESGQLEQQIREFAADPRIGHPIESLDLLQQRCLPPDSAVLEYHLSDRHSYLWLIERNAVRSFELAVSSKISSQVERAVHLFTEIDARRNSRQKQAEYQRLLRQLSSALLGPLRGVRLPPRLIIVPDGALHILPFAALPIPGSVHYLGLVHDLIEAPSATYLTVGRKPRPPAAFRSSILAVADPVFSISDSRVLPAIRKRASKTLGVNLVRLPFMADLDTISETVPESRRRVVTAFDANLPALQRMPLANYGIVHFSTHARIDDRVPERSGVALSMFDASGRAIDGMLHPRQMWNFHLEGSTVVLSACDTALGKLLMGEGLMGFSISLFHAGAAQLVLALTKLDAPASADFFSETFRFVFAKSPVPMDHALTLARRKLAATPSRQDPYYWASIILLGRPSVLQ